MACWICVRMTAQQSVLIPCQGQLDDVAGAATKVTTSAERDQNITGTGDVRHRPRTRNLPSVLCGPRETDCVC